MFDFRLKVFYTAAKRLSSTRAAEELYITQPAVTKHIHEIEGYYKTKLFDRRGTRIRLTPAGDLLLRHAEQIFSNYRNLEFEMSSLNQRHSGRLRIGASTTIAQYVLPPALAAFHRQFRDIKLTLAISNTEQIEQALQKSDIDFGIIEGRSRNNLFTYTPFIKDEIVLAANSNHPLAKKEAIRPGDLLKIPLLLREPGSGTLEVIAHALKPLGIKLSQLQTEMRLGGNESIKAYLLNSDCMAFLSVHSIFKELQDKELSIIDIKGLTIERLFYFIQQKGETEALPGLFMRFVQHYNFK